MKTFKGVILSLLVAMVLVVPVSAETISPEEMVLQLQERIAELEAKLAELTAQLETVEDVDNDTEDQSGSATVRTLPPQASARAHHVQACIQIGRILRRGDSGEEVSQLQEFLKAQGYFDFDRVTGFYGAITEAAVQRFQSENGIVSEGDTRTTGFGQVGPRTRAALAQVSCLRQDAPAVDESSDNGEVTENGNEEEQDDDLEDNGEEDEINDSEEDDNGEDEEE